MASLSGKNILLGVTGSIACYKSVVLLRCLQKEGANVRVIMTPNATKFVSPLSFQALTDYSVRSQLIDHDAWNNHVDLGLWADLFVIAPATAHTIAKIAHGLADDIVGAAYLATRNTIMVAPSMDVDMWHHPATQTNIKTLLDRGVHLVDVGTGYLASGLNGPGRMAEPEEITQLIIKTLSPSSSVFYGKNILITAGPTHEYIDPVRYIGNASTGKMGIAIAEAFSDKGAVVTLVIGPTPLKPRNPNIKLVSVRSAVDMYNAVKQLHEGVDVAVFAAAVADYRPIEVAEEKIKKEDSSLTIELIKNPDIAFEMGKLKKNAQLHIGFALESTTGESYAINKLHKKNFDMIVLNSLEDAGAGFAVDTNKTTFYFKNNNSRKFELKSKEAVAQDIVAAVEELMFTKSN